MRAILILPILVLLVTNSGPVHAIDPYAGNDPFWILLHEPAAIAQLKMSPTQKQAYLTLTDELDTRFFPLRNKGSEEALKGMGEITAEAKVKLKSILQPAQNKRLAEILLRRIGIVAIAREEVAALMGYTDTQREQIQKIIDETRTAVAALEKEMSEGKPREPLDKKFVELKTAEQVKLLGLLTPEQQAIWRKLIGAPFDVSKLGRPAMRVPELIDTGEWINSSPLRMADLRGKVVVVHFYAFGCINCIHNYPAYRAWQEKFKDREVALIGIHTPETAKERDAARVRSKAADEKLEFPILIDGKNENWNAWGNSMWPSVYLIDKRGYLRHFWPGELNWQGAEGEKFMREQVENLLGEPMS